MSAESPDKPWPVKTPRIPTLWGVRWTFWSPCAYIAAGGQWCHCFLTYGEGENGKGRTKAVAEQLTKQGNRRVEIFELEGDFDPET